VKQTLEIFLRSLPEGTLFNIVGFGTHFEKLFDNGSVEYNDKNLEIANQHVKQMNANFGGNVTHHFPFLLLNEFLVIEFTAIFLTLHTDCCIFLFVLL